MATVCDFSQTVFDSESHENAAFYMGKIQMDFFSVCASVGERKYIHLSLDIVNALELAEAVCALGSIHSSSALSCFRYRGAARDSSCITGWIGARCTGGAGGAAAANQPQHKHHLIQRLSHLTVVFLRFSSSRVKNKQKIPSNTVTDAVCDVLES